MRKTSLVLAAALPLLVSACSVDSKTGSRAGTGAAAGAAGGFVYDQIQK